MVRLLRYLPSFVVVLAFIVPSVAFGHREPDVNQLAAKEKDQDNRAAKALYEYEYVKWEDKSKNPPKAPIPEKVRKNLLKNGNTEADINRVEKYRFEQSVRASQERWEKGKIVVRRMGNIVSVEKHTLAIKYGDENWRSIENIREETASNLFLKGVKVPQGFSEVKIRDYSDGKLMSTVGRFGPAGRVDADIDKESSYNFPSTIGAGVLAAPLAGLPVSKFCDIKQFRGEGTGLAWSTKKVARDGHIKVQTFEVDTQTGKLVTFTESASKAPYYTVDVSDYQSRGKGVLVPGKVRVRFQSGGSGSKNQELTYQLKHAEFGDQVDMKDMKSMGPVGTQALDNRLKGPKAVPYVMGEQPKTDAEVRQLAGQSFMREVPENNSPVQLLFIGSGVLLLGGGAFWMAKGRKSPIA